MAPPNYVKIFVFHTSTDIKKNWHTRLSRSKIGFWGSREGWYLKLCQNICLLNIYWYQEKLAP